MLRPTNARGFSDLPASFNRCSPVALDPTRSESLFLLDFFPVAFSSPLRIWVFLGLEHYKMPVLSA